MVIQVKMGIEMLERSFRLVLKIESFSRKESQQGEKRVSQRKFKTSSGDGTLGNGLGIMLSTPLPS